MSEDELQSSKRILDPVERWSEVLFGLIVVLGFTSTVSAVHSGRPEIRTMIVGALGCGEFGVEVLGCLRGGEQGQGEQECCKERAAMRHSLDPPEIFGTHKTVSDQGCGWLGLSVY